MAYHQYPSDAPEKSRGEVDRPLAIRFLEAVPAVCVLVLIAARFGWLTADGAAASALVGVGIYGLTGIRGAEVLLGFFLTATLLGRLSSRRHGPRNARQVLANGGVALVSAVAWAAGARWCLLALPGSLATANADTWATEIGTRWGGPPRSLAWGRILPPHTSGGITRVGTLGGVAGALWIALWWGAFPVLVGGVVGMFADSLLGGTVQVRYRCAVCGTETEEGICACGGETDLVRGVRWVDNDVVNLLATAFGAALTVLVARVR